MHHGIRRRRRLSGFEAVEAEMRRQGVEGLAAVGQIGDQGADLWMIERFEVDVEKLVTFAHQMGQNMPAGLAGSSREYHALACHCFPSIVDRTAERCITVTSVRSNAKPRPKLSCRKSKIPDPVERDGDNNERTDEGALPERADAQKSETVADHLNQRRADQGAEGGANAAG